MEIAEREPQRRVQVLRHSDYLAFALEDAGFRVLGGGTPIVPILIGDDDTAAAISETLFGQGLLVPCVRWPAVARGQSRIRITLMATHERDQLDRLIEALTEAGARFGIL
jgi:7-keto-8-aminopelargonate synthetase-like enzyme